MPVSDMFEVSGANWGTHSDWSGFDGSDANGTSRTENAFKVYTLPTGETVYFPASGYRNNTSGNQSSIGSIGFYWSSSASNTLVAYVLYFTSGTKMNYSDGRSYGYSVRCVRDGENVAP
jgi:uncharacterized protein (TIGR02145 family)